jgi:hypothetical protein
LLDQYVARVGVHAFASRHRFQRLTSLFFGRIPATPTTPLNTYPGAPGF